MKIVYRYTFTEFTGNTYKEDSYELLSFFDARNNNPALVKINLDAVVWEHEINKN